MEHAVLVKKCRQVYGTALRCGLLLPKPCEVCQDPRTDGHHDDYSKPLEVRWLCDKHHAQADKALGVRYTFGAKFRPTKLLLPDGKPLPEHINAIEQQWVIQALSTYPMQTHAAQALGISYRSLRHLMDKYGLC